MRSIASTGAGAPARLLVRGVLAAAALLAATPGARAQEARSTRAPVILVPPFENQSKSHAYIGYEVATGRGPDRPKRRFTVDRYTEAPRSLFEDMLGNLDGVSVVERQRVDALLVESQFGRLSGLVDQDKAVKLGKMLGANLIVLGTIVDLRDEQKNFRGYGIETRITEVQCQLRFRLLEIETGSVRFSKVVKGTKSYEATSYGGTASSDRNMAAIEEALKAIEKDARFRKALLGDSDGAAGRDETRGTVEVEFAPKPDNCDIEIDGTYVGGSPLKRRLKAGQEYKVKVSKGGYKDWQGVIVAEKGLRITRDLGPGR